MLHDDLATTKASRRFNLLVILGCAFSMAFLVMEAYREHSGGEGSRHQTLYQGKLDPRYRDSFDFGIKQAFLPALKRVDRCQTCHIGIDDPAMAEEEQPIRTHPGQILDAHPVQDFGCTICHRGQGRATVKEDAHGRVPHWEEPMLEGDQVYLSCGLCHADNALFGDDTEHFGGRVADREIYASDLTRGIPGAPVLARGKAIMAASGCLGCHVYRRRGGTLGPELTHIGDRTPHEYDYSNLPEGFDHEPMAWQRAHFLDPGAVTPGTVMPGMGVSEEEAAALAVYMVSQRASAVPTRFRPAPMVAKDAPLDGAGLYKLFCVACHGEDLESGTVASILTPSLANEDLLTSATDEYLKHMIAFGRSGTAMPRWDAAGGGLTADQIDRIVGFIRSHAPERPDLDRVLGHAGDAESGEEIFVEICACCHGENGAGGVAPRLNSPALLSVFSDEMLARVIIDGRPDAGMPSIGDYSAEEVADVLAFIDTWRGPGAATEPVLGYVAAGSADEQNGARIFAARCAKCHAEEGQGVIGRSLRSRGFVTSATDSYLAAAIRDGRPGTAMPAFRDLGVAEVGDLIALLRSAGATAGAESVAATGPDGDAGCGALLFAERCSACHGEEGVGGKGPRLRSREFLEQSGASLITEWSGTRRHEGTAGAEHLADMSAAQRADVAAYVYGLRDALPSLAPEQTVRGDAGAGRLLYEGRGRCAACHGRHGEGGSAVSLGSPARHSQTSQGFLIGALVVGEEPGSFHDFGGSDRMELTAREVLDLTAFIRTLPSGFPAGKAGWRPFRRTPGQVEAGRKLFEEACTTCHDPESDMRSGPVIENPAFLTAASDGFLLASIARGRVDTVMAPFGPDPDAALVFTTEDLLNLVGFLRSQE